MHIVKLLSFLFLALYLVVVGLQGMGFPVAFVHPGVLGFFAFVAGVLLFVRGVYAYYCGCKSCDVPPRDKYVDKS